MKTCIVNFACKGRESYLDGQTRLSESLDATGYTGEKLFFREVYPPHSPTHSESPYAFKWWGMKYAVEKGFDKVLWLDASVVVKGDLAPIWKAIDDHKVLVFNNPGIVEAAFTSKDCLDKLGCSLEEAEKFGQCCGGVVGLNMNTGLAQNVLEWMLRCSKDGISFSGGDGTSPYPKYCSHRHDQSCLSYIVRVSAIDKIPFDLLRYSNDSRGLDGCLLELRGM